MVAYNTEEDHDNASSRRDFNPEFPKHEAANKSTATFGGKTIIPNVLFNDDVIIVLVTLHR
jgi:hypothetical protein